AEAQPWTEAHRWPRLERSHERRWPELVTDRPGDAVDRLALERQRGGPGFLAQVGHGAEHACGPLGVAPLGGDPRHVFHQDDRGPVVLRALERRERHGEPTRRAVAV